MIKWLKDLWDDVTRGYEPWDKVGAVIVLVVVLMFALSATSVFAGSAKPPRQHLDGKQDIELCVYRAQMTELVARYWNLGKRDEKEIIAMLAWNGDETEFERVAVKEYITWAMTYFIPDYIARRLAAGKPASTLITYQVGEEAYEVCKYAIEHSHDKTTMHKTASGQPMQNTNAMENFQRASDALYTAYGKAKGKTAEQLVAELAVSNEEFEIDARRYAWILEYIHSAYADSGDPWAWFIRQFEAK